MNIQEFADQLNGRSYGLEMIGTEEQQAKELGFVVVFAQSDDLTKFRGAIDDEVGCYEGAKIYFDTEGLWEECVHDCKYSVAALKKAKTITAIWAKDEWPWQYETDIPHATFKIWHDREPYCLGIVFNIKSLLQVDESVFAIKFADDHFNEIKPGMKMLFVGDPSGDFFTRKEEYEVFIDEDGLFVLDDVHESWSLDTELASEFIIIV